MLKSVSNGEYIKEWRSYYYWESYYNGSRRYVTWDTAGLKIKYIVITVSGCDRPIKNFIVKGIRIKNEDEDTLYSDESSSIYKQIVIDCKGKMYDGGIFCEIQSNYNGGSSDIQSLMDCQIGII